MLVGCVATVVPPTTREENYVCIALISVRGLSVGECFTAPLKMISDVEGYPNNFLRVHHA